MVKIGCSYVCTFFVLFCTVYYLEAISGTYIISVIQSIEKQFQIPSKLSGALISAQDVGYLPTVVLLSYMGSRGNRARWIGGGCILVACANFIISTPQFIFPEKVTVLGEEDLNAILRAPQELMRPNSAVESLVMYAYARNKLATKVMETMLDQLNKTDRVLEFSLPIDQIGQLRRPIDDLADDQLVEDLNLKLVAELKIGSTRKALRKTIQDNIQNPLPQSERNFIMITSARPVGYCDPQVNSVKQLNQEEKCKEDQTNMTAYAIVFCGLIMLGVGHSMPWSLGVPLIDDNVKRRSLPTYFALMFLLKIMGPVSGFFVGSLCNRLYYTLKDSGGLEPTDPRWIGAWWLGFLIIAGVLIGPAIGLFCFPTRASQQMEKDLKEGTGETIENGSSRTPATEKKKGGVNLVDKHRDTRNAVPKHPHDGSFFGKLRSEIRTFGGAILAVIACPVYVFSLAGRVFDSFAFKGFFAFLPKYLDNHYGIPQYKANMFLGTFGIFGFAGGMICGSIAMRVLKLEGRKAGAWIAACTLIASILSVSKVGFGCNSVVNSIGPLGLENNFNFTNTCNAGCGCDSVKLLAVCSQSGQIYYSPCHAGCSVMTDLDNKTTRYTDCACIDEGTEVRRDWCTDDCADMIFWYFAVALVSGLIGGMQVVPAVLMVLRSVPPEWRSISIGFSGFVVSIGTFFSPPFFGFIIDSACLKWEETCYGGGSCLIYDSTELRNRLHIVYGCLRGIGWIFDLFVLYHVKDLKLISGEDDENDDQATNNNNNVSGGGSNYTDNATRKVSTAIVYDGINASEHDDMAHKMSL